MPRQFDLIYCVSRTGVDTATGKFGACWATLPKAKNAMVAGDITYAQDGVTQTAVDNYAAGISVDNTKATAANPIALVGYPGAKVIVGTPTISYSIRVPAISGTFSNWVFAGLYMIGTEAVDLNPVTGWRVIGNEFTCPQASGYACVHPSGVTNMAFYGNYVHNVGDAGSSIIKLYHGVYFTTDSDHIDMGWNIVDNNPSGSTTAGVCRGVQFYSTGGSDQYDVHVHDNIIRNAICDGLNLSTMNPDAGVVEAYNNVIYHVGTGPDPSDSSAAYSCINSGSFAAHTNNMEIYNNTLVDCGSRPGSYSSTGGMTLVIPTRLRNNIVYSVSSNEPYISTGSSPSLISGSNNLYFGNGAGPSQTTGNINADPQFVNLANYNYHVQSTSPAIQAGLSISSLLNSFDGIARPQTGAYDIGAYQAILGDLNGDGAVDCLDLNIVKASFGKKTGQAGFDPRADLNRDGLVDVRDLALVARQVPAGTVCQ